MIDMVNIVDEIMNGKMDEYLDSIQDTIKIRKNEMIQVSMKPGTLVRFKNNIRPAKMRGWIGTIVEVDGNDVIVDLDTDEETLMVSARRYVNTRGLSVPLSLIEPVTTNLE